MQDMVCSKRSITVQCGYRVTDWNKVALAIKALYNEIIGILAVSEVLAAIQNLERVLLMQKAVASIKPSSVDELRMLPIAGTRFSVFCICQRWTLESIRL
jgi:hypothetical protein